VGGGLVGEKEQTKQREWANGVWKIEVNRVCKNEVKMVGGLVGENETKMYPRAGYTFNLQCQHKSIKIN